MYRVAACAEPFIFSLEIEAAVKIQRRAVLIQLGANARAACNDEVDLLGPREDCSTDHISWNAFGSLVLDPIDRWTDGAWLHMYPKDDLVLNDKARNGLLHCHGLGGEKPNQPRNEG